MVGEEDKEQRRRPPLPRNTTKRTTPPGALCCVVDTQGTAGVGARQLCAGCARWREGETHLELTLVLWSCELGPLLLVVLVALEEGREGWGY